AKPWSPCSAEDLVVHQLAACHDPLQCVVIGLEPHVHGHDFKMTFEPKAADVFQSNALSEPAQIKWRLRLPGFGKVRNGVQDASFRMHKEPATAAAKSCERNWAAAPPRVEN